MAPGAVSATQLALHLAGGALQVLVHSASTQWICHRWDPLDHEQLAWSLPPVPTHTDHHHSGHQGVGGAARSRDVSQPSLGTDPDDKEASPPASPMFPSEGTSAASKSKGNVAFTPKLQHAFRKYNDSSLDADETESELVAIPESDLSDSTLHGSSAPVCYQSCNTLYFKSYVYYVAGFL